MRVSIIANDNHIFIDLVAQDTDCTDLLAAGISAVQWEGESGHIEYVGHSLPNAEIRDFSPYQKYIDQSTPFPEEPPPDNTAKVIIPETK